MANSTSELVKIAEQINAEKEREAEQERREEEARNKRMAKMPVTTGGVFAKRQYPDPEYLWHGILPDAGLAVCASSKASGKTLLLLQLCDAISRGRPFLGRPTKQAKVLFLELELSEVRTAQRLRDMGITPIDGFDFAWRCPVGNEGFQIIVDHIIEGEYRLAIIDVMGAIWPAEADLNDYQEVYGILSPLRQAANDIGCLIMLVTHLRKSEALDSIDRVLGSVGVTGNSDVVLAIQRERGSDEAVLDIISNVVPEGQIPLKFNINPLGFELSDASPDEIGQGRERRAILEALRELGGSAKTGQIAEAVGMTGSNCSHLLSKLAKQGLVFSAGYGQWAVKTPIQSVQSVQSYCNTDKYKLFPDSSGIQNVQSENATLNTLNTLNGTFGGENQTSKEDNRELF